MKRQEVYKVIDSERDFQEEAKKSTFSHVVEEFPLAAGITAIDYNLDKIKQAWYNEKAPYPNSMEYMRKVAAIAVVMGEQYGMPERFPHGEGRSKEIGLECNIIFNITTPEGEEKVTVQMDQDVNIKAIFMEGANQAHYLSKKHQKPCFIVGVQLDIKI